MSTAPQGLQISALFGACAVPVSAVRSLFADAVFPPLSPQLLPGGTECRASTNECDLPEYCNGTSQFCQADFTVQNGHPCHNQEAYCYNGLCQYHDAQCQDIFGSSKEEHSVTIFLTHVMKDCAECIYLLFCNKNQLALAEDLKQWW